jgi:histidyl-tRNA synthetase
MKPNIPKGTRDFGPDQVRKRDYIFHTIRQVFVKYGYQPIETPTMELLSTLTGKYGEEGDQLLFKVLNNGDFLKSADQQALEEGDSAKLTPSISKRGLRYDLTVPFARFVVMHQHDLPFPFKRYQIQPVWRADRPQKGRYREFYQCDVDVVGSDSLMYEAELMRIYDEVFAALGLRVEVRYSNRKILAGMAEVAGISDQFVDMTTAIDKLDKIGKEGVREEMVRRGIPAESAERIENMLEVTSLDAWQSLLADSEIGQKGVEELRTLQRYLSKFQPINQLVFTPTLARGLNYYTGCIFEVLALDAKMGSIGGGGRYDDLTGIFGLKGVSGVGVSFGAERIYDVMEELKLFPAHSADELQVLLIAFDPESHEYAFGALDELHQHGVRAELYPEPVKLKKQMKYANARNVPYVILIGASEMESGQLSFKDMASGEQESLILAEIIQRLNP